MTARQVMDEIKIMTPEERGQVAEFLRQLNTGEGTRKADDTQVEAISDRILDRHSELMRKLAL